MKRISFAASTIALIFVTNAAKAAPPAGSWPTFGHDFQRTGRADGVGSMHAPKVAWTLPLGGLLSAGQFVVSDINVDGRPETVTITGGRVIASRPDGSTLWSGALLGATGILGVWDLDGSGSAEVVAETANGVLIMAGTDGHVITSLPVVDHTVQATFVPESKGGILVLAQQRAAVSGYDFRNGTNVTAPAWTITGANQTSEVAGDVDGDGVTDLVRPLDDGFEVDDPLTGKPKYSLAGMGPAAYFYLYQLQNVDGQPGEEIIAVDTSYIYSPQCGIYVAGVQGGALKTLWSSTATPTVALGNDYFSVGDAAADLNGDGKLELVFSEWSASSAAWTTTIADAASGTSLGTIAGEFLQAVADVDGDGNAEVVARAGVQGDQSPERSLLSVYDFTTQGGAVAKSWTSASSRITALDVIQYPGPGFQTPVIADFDPATPGLEMLIGIDQKSANADTNLIVVHGGDGSTASTYAVPPTVHPSILSVTNAASSSSSANDVILAQDDGAAHVLDKTLVDHDHFAVGSYGNWLHALATGSGEANLYAATSNNHLSWIDGRQLHVGGSPYVRVDELNVVATSAYAEVGSPLDPAAILNGPSLTVVTFEQGPTTTNIVAHGTSGVAKWSVSLDPGSSIDSPGAYALDLTGDGNDDLLVDVVNANTVESVTAYDGTSGTLLFSTPLGSIQGGADDLLTGSLVDVNGDGKLDLVAPIHIDAAEVAINLFAQPVSELWLSPSYLTGSYPETYNGTVSSGTVGDAGVATLLRSNGNSGLGPYESLSLTGGILASGDQGLPVAHGFDDNAAVLVRSATAGAFDLVSAGTADVGLSRIRRIAGDTMTTMWTAYAANGAILSSAPMPAYPLHDPIVFDVDGNGADDIVFGSDDGFLYAVSADDGSLKFAVNLATPVHHVIAANIDLDPQLEIVAALTDGRLVAIDDSYQAVQDGADGGTDGGGDASMDAGGQHDSGSQGDGASEASIDSGGADAESEAGSNGPGPGSGGGCGCNAVGAEATPAAALLAMAGLVLAGVRRGRRRS